MFSKALDSALARILLVKVPSPIAAASRASREQSLAHCRRHRRDYIAAQPFICLPRASPISTKQLSRCLSTISVESERTESGFKPQECPACGQQCFRPLVLQRHLERCCPDLLKSSSGLDLTTMDMESLELWLREIKEKEDKKREQAVRIILFRKRVLLQSKKTNIKYTRIGN